MKKWWWTSRLCFWLVRYGYYRGWNLKHLWKWAGEECWQSYRDDGETPEGAVLEDLSYG